jgi:hypothetical protein
MLIKINSQKNTLRLHQAETLSNKARESLKNDNRYGAIKHSFEALTEFDGVSMPYTSEAEYELVESLGLYDAGSSYKAISELQTEGIASMIKTSLDGDYGLVYDESETLTLFDSKTLKKIEIFDLTKAYTNNCSFTFMGNDKSSYINKEGNIIIINNKDGKQIKEIEKKDSKYKAVKGNEDYLAYVDDNNVYIYDIKNDNILGNISSEDDYLKEMFFSEDKNYLFVSSEKKNYDINEEDYITVHVIDIEKFEEINSKEINASYLYGMLTKGDNVYMLFNRSLGVDFNMVVVSYNYISNEINWSNSYEKNFGKFITKSYPEDTNNIAVVNGKFLSVLDADTGEIVERFNTDSEIINVYSYMDKDEMEEIDASPKDFEGVCEKLRETKGVSTSFFMYRQPDGKIKGSLRGTDDNVDLSRVANNINGGGHKKAAGFGLSDISMEEATRIVIEELIKEYEIGNN